MRHLKNILSVDEKSFYGQKQNSTLQDSYRGKTYRKTLPHIICGKKNAVNLFSAGKTCGNLFSAVIYICGNLIYHCGNLIYHCGNLIYHCGNLIYHCGNSDKVFLFLLLFLRLLHRVYIISLRRG
eukprot:Lithocolla_globosa_v1_NODE_1521_length_2514_cov_56.965041.p2 type:complete len:125 gc:universal NODE_1521_length_2514_cov_56.965041:194-568(+)